MEKPLRCANRARYASRIPSPGVRRALQRSSSGLGGASTLTCTVTVTNNLTGYPIGAAIDSTVVQCQNPGAVGTLTCVATPAGTIASVALGPAARASPSATAPAGRAAP